MRIATTALALLFTTACSGGNTSEPEAADAGAEEPTARATWHQDVAPILAKHCVSCHTDGGIGPFSLESYNTASSLAPILVNDEPANECLVNLPRWDFDWQQTYFYDAEFDDLPTIGPGDTVKIECGYDNSIENPGVIRMLEDEGLDNPVDVVLGEETTDEMCLIIMGIILEIPSQP